MRALAREFVCAADEVWRLQRGSEADCVFFQRAVNDGERITDRGTRQGTWILSPSGKVLARFGTRDVEKVLVAMRRGLAEWAALEEEDRRLPEDLALEPRHRWEHDYPADGLVLERYAREVTEADARGPWSVDYAWCSAAEVRALVPEDVAAGRELDWGLLARRLARFHLVDNVRGQTLPYAVEELREAGLTARVVEVTGTSVTLHLEGRTHAVAEGPWLMGENLWKPNKELPHSIECRLAGRARFDLSAGRFEHFELAAVGRHTGRTGNNGRWRDPSPGLVAFHLRSAPDAPRVAPTFIAVYDADWVRRPAVETWRRDPAEAGL